MGDSSSFTSLFALVEDHLSKTSLEEESQPSTSGLQFRSTPFHAQRGQSDTRLRSRIFPMRGTSRSVNRIPNSLPKAFGSFSDDDDEPKVDNEPVAGPSHCMSDRHINEVLAMQLSNMFKAKEAREEEERKKEELKKVEDNMQKLMLEQSSSMIDLMPAVQQSRRSILPQDVDIPSSDSSMESLVMPDAGDESQAETSDEEEARPETPKPITTDMRYILKHKIARCSSFGKVLCARYRPMAAPYFRVRVPHNIRVFDFTTPSPDDIMLERLRKPSFYRNSSNTLSVFD